VVYLYWIHYSHSELNLHSFEIDSLSQILAVNFDPVCYLLLSFIFKGCIFALNLTSTSRIFILNITGIVVSVTVFIKRHN
jgi:hypothetical protein